MSEPRSRPHYSVSEEDVCRVDKSGACLDHCVDQRRPSNSFREETSAVRPRKLPYKPVIGELENRQTERFL